MPKATRYCDSSYGASAGGSALLTPAVPLPAEGGHRGGGRERRGGRRGDRRRAPERATASPGRALRQRGPRGGFVRRARAQRFRRRRRIIRRSSPTSPTRLPRGATRNAASAQRGTLLAAEHSAHNANLDAIEADISRSSHVSNKPEQTRSIVAWRIAASRRQSRARQRRVQAKRRAAHIADPSRERLEEREERRSRRERARPRHARVRRTLERLRRRVFVSWSHPARRDRVLCWWRPENMMGK